MADLIIPPERALPAALLDLARAVTSAAAAVGATTTIVGATARDIVLGGVHGIRAERATNDLDVAIAVATWKEFDQVIAELLRDPRFEQQATPHRLHFSQNSRPPIPLDLIPYGNAVEKPTFRWPNAPEIEMNVSGYEEATAHAVQVALRGDLIVNVLSVPGQALLKLCAWMDRNMSDTKDALDLALLLSCYVDAGNRDRLYDEAIDCLEALDYDEERAGPYLLGMDVAAILSDTSRTFVDRLFQDAALRERLTLGMERRWRGDVDALRRAESLLENFREGIRAAA